MNEPQVGPFQECFDREDQPVPCHQPVHENCRLLPVIICVAAEYAVQSSGTDSGDLTGLILPGGEGELVRIRIIDQIRRTEFAKLVFAVELSIEFGTGCGIDRCHVGGKTAAPGVLHRQP